MNGSYRKIIARLEQLEKENELLYKEVRALRNNYKNNNKLVAPVIELKQKFDYIADHIDYTEKLIEEDEDERLFFMDFKV